MMFILTVKFFKGMLFIDYLIFQKSYYFLELMDVCSSGFMDLFTTFITCIIFSSHIVDILRGRLSIGLAYFFHGFLMDTF